MDELKKEFNLQVNKIIDKNLFDWEIAKDLKDPELTRIFAPLRWNVLNWIPFSSNDAIVELGGNYGEFSVRLSDLVSQVFVFEPDIELAEIIKKRCHYAENVLLCTDTIEEFIRFLPEKIDKIIVHNISIFRNSNHMINSLRLLFQKYPDSISIIMCDNRKGVQYGNFKIDEDNQSVQSFLLSKEELDGIICSIGYPEHLYYYPYPDSAYAMSIFSDSFLPQKDSITLFEITNTRVKDYVDSQEEFESIKQSIINGNFIERTNSFLVLAGRSMDSIPKYIKYSNQRADYYNIRTEIYRENEVRKIPLNKSGKRHIECIKRYGDIARKQYINSILQVPEAKIRNGMIITPYIKGNNLSFLLDNALKKSEKEFLTLLCEWRDVILSVHNNSFFSKTPEFIRIFGDLDISPESRSGTVNNIDLVFDNIIISRNGNWNVIDNEWSFEFPIPVKFILYRGFLYYFIFRKNIISEMLQNEVWSMLDVNYELREIFSKMESHFQKYCVGRNRKYI